VQQLGIIYNARKRDSLSQSVFQFGMLLPNLKRSANKDWVRRVPAAAVIPAAQVVAAIIGPKTSVAGSINAWVNRTA
jgi:hypothetical protein